MQCLICNKKITKKDLDTKLCNNCLRKQFDSKDIKSIPKIDRKRETKPKEDDNRRNRNL